MLSVLVEISKALADESRLRIIVALEGQELCVCQLTELLGLATSTVSKHISILRRAGILAGRKSSRWVFYSLNTANCADQAGSAIQWVLDGKTTLPCAKSDLQKLKEILRTDPEELCRKQSRS